jgi:hypothetical protein
MNGLARLQAPAKPRIPAVFIGCSAEALEIAENLKHAMQSSKIAVATIWKQAFSPVSGGTLESLVDGAERFDFAILIVTPDTQVSARGRAFSLARANVLFEIGLFVGTLGRERTFIVAGEQDEVELPSNLHGATIARFQRPSHGNLKASMMPAVITIREAIRSLGPRTEWIRSAAVDAELKMQPRGGPRTTIKELLKTHHGWYVAYSGGQRIALEPSLAQLVAAIKEKLGPPPRPACEFHEVVEQPSTGRGPSPRLWPTRP